MNKEVVSEKQGIALLIMFIIGTSSIEITGMAAGKDTWIAIITAVILMIPIMLMYEYFHRNFPNKDLYDIIMMCFGKFLGKIIMILYTWYFFDEVALVTRNYSSFVVTVSLAETKVIVIEIGILILCGWIVKKGIEVTGRCARLWTVMFIILMTISICLELPNMSIVNILPVLEKGIKPVIEGIFKSIGFPFGQLIVFMMIFPNVLKKKNSIVYIKGFLIGSVILFVISLTNLLVLGVGASASAYYPTYITISRISVGKVIQRIEIVAGIILTLGAFIKISIFLMAACKGIAKIFECNDYKFAVTVITLLAINLTYFEFGSVMELYEYGDTSLLYFSFVFQIVFPILIWITSILRKKKIKLLL
ncbi:endospore germination permease [Wukongibacter baidiensis]|uniref:GerAB/ArcD/ProY family transporter n=1 Tax=Wukongibacter baidiensis TaxID=1723361 RepID=UPI003D7F4F30